MAGASRSLLSAPLQHRLQEESGSGVCCSPSAAALRTRKAALVVPLTDARSCTRARTRALQVYMAAGDHAGLIAAVSRYGDVARGGDPQLWAEVLQYFVEQPGSSCEPQVRSGALALLPRQQGRLGGGLGMAAP